MQEFRVIVHRLLICVCMIVRRKLDTPCIKEAEVFGPSATAFPRISQIFQPTSVDFRLEKAVEFSEHVSLLQPLQEVKNQTCHASQLASGATLVMTCLQA